MYFHCGTSATGNLLISVRAADCRKKDQLEPDSLLVRTHQVLLDQYLELGSADATADRATDETGPVLIALRALLELGRVSDVTQSLEPVFNKELMVQEHKFLIAVVDLKS